ncbi:TPA: hypothetical protein H1009_01555, partial [archaeon]|nr:hypothetical protein [Candidatus Naiadarchaeales archaeon SRR2090153.bin461]
MAKQFKLLAGIILIFAFLIAVNPVFAECSPDSSGACIANETTPTEPGNYTYTVCIGNSCKNITVSVQSDAISVLIDPSTVEFGQILAGGGAIGDVSVTNLGNQTISSLTAETSGTRLSATLDSTEILPQQTVVITVLLATLGTDSAGSKFESVTLAGTAPSQPFGVTIPVRYAVFRNDTQNYTN